MTVHDVADAAREAPDLQAEVERLRLLQAISQEFNSSLDLDALLPQVFSTVLKAVLAEGGSLWIAEGDMLRCMLAVGGAGSRLVGAQVPVGTGFVGDVASRQRTTIVTKAVEDPRYQAGMDATGPDTASTVMATAMVAQGTTVGAIQVSNKRGGAATFDAGDRALLEGMAASAAIAIRNAQLLQSEKRATDLAVLLDISREISSTLDLDRVLRSVVNLAARALPFDRGAACLIEHGKCEIRALAGEATVDQKDPRLSDLAARAEWAAGRGESFYLTDRHEPGSDAERLFVTIFGQDLDTAEIRSGLYLPLGDEEGQVGVLVFEAREPDFLTPQKQELAGVLANQTAVAMRNAQLYHQVPLAETLGSLAARRRAFMELPKQRRRALLAVGVVLLAAVTLIRWPLRVGGAGPRFLPVARADVRPLVAGTIERVLVHEGDAVSQGAVLAMLRDPGLRAGREALAADQGVALRLASSAAARGDAAAQQLQQGRAAALGRQLALTDEQIDGLTIRAPIAGVVLTARPEQLTGVWLDAGDPFVTLGRTDTLELEFGVDERDLPRVRLGDRVHLRVDALPQRTFDGRVTSIGELPIPDSGAVRYPVRAAVPNADGLLRPGMAAYAKVLTAPASLLGRVVRAPARWARLLWWRMKP